MRSLPLCLLILALLTLTQCQVSRNPKKDNARHQVSIPRPTPIAIHVSELLALASGNKGKGRTSLETTSRPKSDISDDEFEDAKSQFSQISNSTAAATAVAPSSARQIPTSSSPRATSKAKQGTHPGNSTAVWRAKAAQTAYASEAINTSNDEGRLSTSADIETILQHCQFEPKYARWRSTSKESEPGAAADVAHSGEQAASAIAGSEDGRGKPFSRQVWLDPRYTTPEEVEQVLLEARIVLFENELRFLLMMADREQGRTWSEEDRVRASRFKIVKMRSLMQPFPL